MRQYRMININGISIQTAILGEGYPVFIIHGGPGGCHRIFGDYLDELAKDFKIIYYDQRNQGTSSIVDPKELTMDNIVDDLAKLAHQLGYQKYALLGHSFGGFVALECALRYPNEVSHLILLNVVDRLDEISKYRTESLIKSSDNNKKLHEQFLEKRNQAYELYNRNDPRAIDVFKSAYKLMIHDESLQVCKEEQEKFKDVLQHTRFNLDVVFKYGGQILKNYDVSDRLSEITSKTLLITGEDDTNLNPQTSIEMSKKIDNSRLLVIPKAGHNAYVEKPEVITEEIIKFMI